MDLILKRSKSLRRSSSERRPGAAVALLLTEATDRAVRCPVLFRLRVSCTEGEGVQVEVVSSSEIKADGPGRCEANCGLGARTCIFFGCLY